MRSEHRATLAGLVALVAAAGFHDLARRYDGFRIYDGPPTGHEMHPTEVTFVAFFVVLGTVVAVGAAMAIANRRDDLVRLGDAFRRAAQSPWFLPLACLAMFVEVLLVKDQVLAGAAVSDDENVYVFIAKTLARGHVTNAPPRVAPEDVPFFESTFVVLKANTWFGKYPIGHPLFLSLGELLDARVVVGPLLAVGSLVATHALARRFVGPTGGAIAVLLLLISPQEVFTAATEHSQNTSQLAMLLALLAALAARERTGRDRLVALLATGGALGFGILARPMPGALFVVAIGAVLAAPGAPLGRRARDIAVTALPIGVFGAIFMAANAAQTGSPFVTGYQMVHGRIPGVDDVGGGLFSASVVTALVRQSVWAFGWPLGFCFLPLATRPARDGAPSPWPIWALLAADYAYRLTTPKVFVGVVGPIYVAESVPLLAVLTAAGMMRARGVLDRLVDGGSRIVPSFVLGSSVAAVALFLPFQLQRLADEAAPQRYVPDVLAANRVERALVFATNVSVTGSGESWALFPPPASPGLDEPLIYVRKKVADEKNIAFWKRYFPERRAFVLDVRGGVRSLRPIDGGAALMPP